MPTAETEKQAARRQLEQVLASAGFSRNERLARFLRFVVERHLEGRDDELKESVIAVEVFDRSPDHDPRQDSIVRTEAGRLRARLSEYYLAEGNGDEVVIELPKGGYVPVFRHALETSKSAARSRAQRAPRLRRAVPLAVGSVCLAVALAAVGWWWVQHKSAPIPIAVLPLINLSQDPANDYFADGLTSEIIRNLSIIDGLAVRSQTSSFAFKGKPQKAGDVGRQLAAEYLVEGSVLRSGQQLRIDAQLVRVRDDFPLWSGRYDRELTDIFAIQDEISRGIVNSLRLKLGRGRRRYETSTEAYDLYLRARAVGSQFGLRGYDQSIPLFEQAIAKDPSFAPAYAGLAAVHAARSGVFRVDMAGAVSEMRAAAARAIQLDPLSAEAYDALGMACARDGQWGQSEKSFLRAIELDANRSTSFQHFATYLLWPLGRIEEALQRLRIAEKADPLSPGLRYDVASTLLSAGRYEEAAGRCQNLPADFPPKSSCLAWACLGQGRVAEAIRILEADFHRQVPPGSWDRTPLGCAYARVGRREEAERLAAEISTPLNQAQVFACLGDRDRTLEALDRAAAAGPVRMGRALTGREFSLLRADPRLKALRRKVGLPE